MNTPENNNNGEKLIRSGISHHGMLGSLDFSSFILFAAIPIE